MQKFLAGLGPLAPFVVFLLAAGESAAFLGLVVPGEVAVILGGVVAGAGHIPLWAMATAAVLGAVVGDSVGYEMGRKFGPAMLDRPRLAKTARHLDRASHFVGQRGWWALVLARFTSVLRAVVPFAAGMGRMPYPRFLFGNVLGGIAWGLTFTWVGYIAGANYQTIERWFRTGGLVIVGLLVIIGGVVSGTRWVARHQAAVLRRLQPVLGLRPVAFIVRHATSPGRGRTLVLSATAMGASLWVFAGLLQDVLGREEFFFFDQSSLSYLASNQVPAVAAAARFINSVSPPPYVFGLAALVGAAAMIRRRPRLAIALGIAALGQWAIIEGVEALVSRTPPPFDPLAARTDYGFPSEHVAAFTTVAVMLAWPWSRPPWTVAVRRFGAAAVAVVLVAASRVVLLIEYPSDVLAAIGVAVAWTSLVAVALDPRTALSQPRSASLPADAP